MHCRRLDLFLKIMVSIVFADDTGLEVDSLGEPGVFSARYAGIPSNAKDNINKVLSKLVGKKNRLAKFRTVIALIIDGNEMTFEGKCDGVITHKVKGKKALDMIQYLFHQDIKKLLQR